MKYYLSGAITRQPNFKEYFKDYESRLRFWGAKNVFNPAAIDWPKDAKWENCMKYDLAILMNCDCLVLLPNWKKSRGAKLERKLCKELGIRVVKFVDLVQELIPNAT